MKFLKIRNVKAPNRAHPHDAGIDFFVPEFDKEFMSDTKARNIEFIEFFKDETINIHSGDKILIPSGIKVDVPVGYALIAFNKSGIASKSGIDLLASVVDSGYQGEVHISIINHGKKIFSISPGMKLIQFVLVKIGLDQLEETKSEEELYENKSDRGEAGFDSTQNK